MRLPEDYEYSSSRLSMKYMAIGVSLCLLLILGAVVWSNKEADAKKHKEKEGTPVLVLEHEGTGAQAEEGAGGAGASFAGGGMEGETSETSTAAAVMGFNGAKSLEVVERLYAEKRLVASDLDFWDMYPETEPVYASTVSGQTPGQTPGQIAGQMSGWNAPYSGAGEDGWNIRGSEGKKDGTLSRYEEKAEKELQEEEEKREQDPSTDGKHTKVTLANGEEEWVLINPYLEKHTYDFANLTMRQGQLAYYADGRTFSYVGADLSKYNGEVDFVALKQSGVSFVMLRLGMRGYGTGQIMLDEKFTDYMAKASEAGLNVGVYFYSQAITEAEAVEEANFVVQNLANYRIAYPVAFDMEYVANDTARVEALDREEKTKMAKAFLDTVKAAGYKPMVYGTKEWLLKQMDLTKLADYDIWLSQQEETPDYPYRFQMWQYSREGNLSGAEGNLNLNISFVDYAEK